MIVEHELRAEQVRATHVAAAKVGTMAGAAGNAVQLLPASNRRWITRWPLLGRERPRATPTSTLAAGRLLPRRSVRSLRNSRGRRLRADLDGQQRQDGKGSDSQTRSGSHQSPRLSVDGLAEATR
jgi:hypothetical protein